MANGYAPALFLEVLAFWFVLRWLLPARLVLFLGRAVVVMMVVGVFGTLGEHRLVWASCFAGSAVLALLLLRRWRRTPTPQRPRFQLPSFLAWRGSSADEVATLCERRIGVQVDAAAPGILAAQHPERCVLVLAGDGVWVLEDESRMHRPRIGRVLACWDRGGLVAHVERSHRGQRFELSWPRTGALVRGLMPRGAPADGFAGCLLADELNLRS
jgi:hypothetical protein